MSSALASTLTTLDRWVAELRERVKARLEIVTRRAYAAPEDGSYKTVHTEQSAFQTWTHMHVARLPAHCERIGKTTTRTF